MRAAILLVIIVTFLVGQAIKANCYETKILINVTTDDKNMPEKITIEEMQTNNPPVELKKMTTPTICYQIEVCPDCKTEDQKRLKVDYLLVALWGDGQEQVLLALGQSLSEQKQNIDIPIYRKSFKAYDRADLEEIKGLPDNQISRWKKYFQARMFHMYWRQKDKELPIAIESAWVWFDTVAKLALARNSCILMDEALDKFLQEYEEKAKEDKTFARRYRQHFREGYYEGIKQQLIAKKYVPVGEVPKLVAKGDLETAKAINGAALAAISKEPEEIQQIVLATQRVNKDLLIKNAAYIDGRIMNLSKKGNIR
jgi:hypothetical protein